MEELNYMMPRIGDQAPDFKVITTTGELTLSEYNKGSWVILFSHPADFTPVCTTEMTGFALEKDFFAAHNTKLLGLSIDSIHSHIAWVNAVHEKTGVLFEFPIIADLDMRISKLYGMLQPGESETAAVRAVFFVDPTGKIIKKTPYWTKASFAQTVTLRSDQTFYTKYGDWPAGLSLSWILLAFSIFFMAKAKNSHKLQA